jgi:hypothetical protein
MREIIRKRERERERERAKEKTWITPEYGFWLDSKTSAAEIFINPDDATGSWTIFLDLSS